MQARIGIWLTSVAKRRWTTANRRPVCLHLRTAVSILLCLIPILPATQCSRTASVMAGMRRDSCSHWPTLAVRQQVARLWATPGARNCMISFCPRWSWTMRDARRRIEGVANVALELPGRLLLVLLILQPMMIPLKRRTVVVHCREVIAPSRVSCERSLGRWARRRPLRRTETLSFEYLSSGCRVGYYYLNATSSSVWVSANVLSWTVHYCLSHVSSFTARTTHQPAPL